MAAVSARGGEIVGLKTDATSASDVQAAVDSVLARWGRIDVLVNNAGGFAAMRALEDTPESEWDAILRSNLTSAFLVCKAVVPIMKRQRAGRIVNLASVVARGGAVRVPAHYAAAKAGVVALTRMLALEVADHGITVNAVAPGTTATDRVLAARTADETARVAAAIPLRPTRSAGRDRPGHPLSGLRRRGLHHGGRARRQRRTGDGLSGRSPRGHRVRYRRSLISGGTPCACKERSAS